MHNYRFEKIVGEKIVAFKFKNENLSEDGKVLLKIYEYLKKENTESDPKKLSEIELNKISILKTDVAVKSNPEQTEEFVSCFGVLPEPPEKCDCVILTSEVHRRHLWVAEEWKKYEKRCPPPKNPSRCKYVYPASEEDEYPETTMDCGCYVLSSKTHINHLRIAEELKNKRKTRSQKQQVTKKVVASKAKKAMKK